ncbi:MAG: Retron-type reverse transcriptase [Candidatus Giovannonibacteria bacterium GW2011_GWC2_44_9]|uniref:Retron-type reverse transcriptase n=3 Tax=Candidatus Giovannoniibacteriota TaxID=1752738 RepID=A0A0G1L628_9BACT|nr:MAG: Retron-type reverse transcriptase [Candidatus Giovannonibacteria bacterium GW2011_GWB1_44_23]KKT64057.1 MAG: Retron-type reverse transcriptase [Candidatus Giovannonibacteria bacterium GW2011_GWA1_44_29]KKT84181.1 MAG: Retron-type reverse transcriptase [Candidatus Giovannonibacteria bacterium GW2011_GWC2_44_9]KKT91905.1 MAG: Retron-type reverse transcriptase [Parcubacteria group bacterium GW2011_GWC1_45_13]
MEICENIFNKITLLENLFSVWDKFKKGKQNKPDIQAFEFNLEENIFKLHYELLAGAYRHAPYHGFYVRDPKVRHIHKAAVRDRVLHHAVFRVLSPIFEPTFIANSFSCRIGKGTHKGVAAMENATRKASRNYSGPCFALKCDIRKFFYSVDHQILKKILVRRIKDVQALWLCAEIIDSFESKNPRERESKCGLPIGNLTSQLFANIYLNEFDQFIKHKLKIKYYFRYTDDFIILSRRENYLKLLLPIIKSFLKERLKLQLHPNKVFIRKLSQGIDFLGYVVLPYHRVLRTTTKRRMFKKINAKNLQSYLGILKHCMGYKLRVKVFERLGIM